jgi:O-antigen/teichoic acid export membrane protein
MSAVSRYHAMSSLERVRRLIKLLRNRPTWAAQGISAISSLVLVTLFTRSLHRSDFATYAVVIAVYSFGAALVGTTIGTRAIKHLSADGHSKILLVIRRDIPPILGCLLAAVGVTLITRSSPVIMVSAGAGMLGILTAQIGGSHLLGLHRYWAYAGLVLVQMALWDTAALIVVLAFPEPDRLAGALIAVAIGGLGPAAYMLLARAMVVVRGGSEGRTSPISAVGVASLSLWILASGDRVILAHYSLSALATYAAIYGLLDRIFRTIATAEFQQRLPQAFATHAKTGRVAADQSIHSICLLIGVGLICSVSGPTIISIVSGGNYHPSLIMSTVLSFAMMAMLAAIPAFVTLVACGRTRIVAIIAITAASFNVIGNLLLAPHYDTSSATALTLFGYLIWLSGVVVAERRYRLRDAHANPITT